MRRVGKAKRAHASVGMRQRRAFAHRFGAPLRILDDRWLAGWKPKACAFYPPGETSVACECVMKDELTTILDAMRAAQAELADYLVSADRNAELTIAKLVGILDRRDVVKAMRLLRASERPGRVPQATLAEAS